MKTPRYWQNKNIISTLLSPFGCVYGLATALRIKFKKGYRAKVPVICIGNVTAGGVGKTPVAMSVAELLKSHGKKPFFVSRGFGGHLSGVLVDTKTHTAYDVGDEPLMLASVAPTVVCPNRAEGARLAEANGADIIIMDDGFQNPGLKKDISFLVFNGELGIGNGQIIPAGPLRESLKSGLKRADAVIFIGEDKTGLLSKIDKPVFCADIVEQKPKHQSVSVIAFAGIGYPQKFYRSLEKCGLKPVNTYDFADHHMYTKDELKAILKKAKKKNLPVYTTSKDYVKIPTDMQKDFCVLEIRADFKQSDALWQFMAGVF